jgi:hypothetical protein
MVREQSKYGSIEHDLKRDDVYFGLMLNKALPDTVDYTNWECYGFQNKDGKTVFAFAYHSYIETTCNRLSQLECELAVASFDKHWATKRRISIMLSLFFNRDRYNRITVLIGESNEQAVKFSKLAGFTLEGTIRKPAGNENLLQFSLLKEEWLAGDFCYGWNS